MRRRKRIRAAAVLALLRLSALFPLPVAHALGAGLGWVLFFFPSEVGRVTRINLELCFPELSRRARRRLLRRSLVETGKTALEAGPLWLWPMCRFSAAIRGASGEEQLTTAMAGGRGVVLIVPHLGAWEAVGLYCAARFPMTSLYRRPRMPALDEPVRRARERSGARLVPTTTAGVRGLYEALQAGQLVAILPDQDPGKGAGVFVDFFGVPANTAVLPHRLIRRTGAKVIIAVAERLPRGRGFHIHFVPGPEGVYSGDPLAATRGINAGIEGCVRKIPEQYQWSYRRFRTRPAGCPPLY